MATYQARIRCGVKIFIETHNKRIAVLAKKLGMTKEEFEAYLQGKTDLSLDQYLILCRTIGYRRLPFIGGVNAPMSNDSSMR